MGYVQNHEQHPRKQLVSNKSNIAARQVWARQVWKRATNRNTPAI